MAFIEITLVLFTTIAPAGIIAYVLMAIAAISKQTKKDSSQISHYLVVPLVLVISGLIASATHLGTPANALYVVAGVGSSPLSNEVLALVLFLVVGGIYWIVSFRDDLDNRLEKIWLLVASLSGLISVGFISIAYSVSSVPTWSLGTVPAALWLNALSSGPAVGLVGLLLARQSPTKQFTLFIFGLAALASVINMGVLLCEWHDLNGIETTLIKAADLAQALPLIVAFYAFCSLVSIIICTRVALSLVYERKNSPFIFKSGKKYYRNRCIAAIIGAFIILCGCFGIRFIFYALHMTVGI